MGEAKTRAKRRASLPPPVFVDVFSGCGGLSLGLMQAGWKGLFAVEKDKFAFETLRYNLCSGRTRYSFDWPSWLDHRPLGIDELLARYKRDLAELRGSVDLLVGGPPCQGFSSAGRRKPTDPRNALVKRYLELVKILQPRMVLLENVRGFTSEFKDEGSTEGHNFSEEVIAALRRRYYIKTEIIKASDFGVPQRRPRFFLVGCLKADNPDWIDYDPFDAMRNGKRNFLESRGLPLRPASRLALSDLEVERNGTRSATDSPGYQAIGYRKPRTGFQRAMRVGASGPPSDTRLAKHRKPIVKRFTKVIALCKREDRLSTSLSKKAKARFGTKKTAFRVLDPMKPSPTITSMPDDLLHYNEPRTLTVRENARLQTFPDWFEFKGKYTTGGERRRREVPRFTQVANAVPPLLAEQLGLVLRSSLPR